MRCMRQWCLVVLVSAIAVCSHAQAPASQEYAPTLGQDGKDVIWLPSPQAIVDKMLDMARVTPADFVMDLGSGDGRLVITAAKRGARALGVEYNPDMVGLSRRNAAAAGVGDRAKFVEADIFNTDLSPATVITLFLLPELNIRLRPTLLSMKPGTRIVSNTFDMEEWEPEEVFDLKCETYCSAFLWIVPAPVQGTWRLARGELVLTQKFQKINGILRTEAGAAALFAGRLRGEEISFVAGGAHYRGRVAGNVMQGTVRSGGGAAPWSARR